MNTRVWVQQLLHLTLPLRYHVIQLWHHYLSCFKQFSLEEMMSGKSNTHASLTVYDEAALCSTAFKWVTRMYFGVPYKTWRGRDQRKIYFICHKVHFWVKSTLLTTKKCFKYLLKHSLHNECAMSAYKQVDVMLPLKTRHPAAVPGLITHA